MSVLLATMLIFGCRTHAPDEEAYAPVAAAEYIPGMWSARAQTVQAGLDEALALRGQGDRDGAGDLVEAVYHGSFEPELEPLIRDHFGAPTSVAMEYQFGLVRDAIQTRRAKPDDAIAPLVQELVTRAQELDQLEATL